jgi:CrcB protein
MLKTIAVIAGGGAIGAVMRYGVHNLSVKAFGPDFPWGTLIVNVAGSLAIGVLVALFAHFSHISQEMRLFLITGVLGAFTTFSAFSLDFVNLWERGAFMAAALYLSASVVLSIAAVFAALATMKHVLS